MKSNNLILSILTALAVVLTAVSANAATRGKAEHVILIGLDGWGAYSVPKADMPNVKSLMANGTHTLKSAPSCPRRVPRTGRRCSWALPSNCTDTPSGVSRLRNCSRGS